MAFSWGEGSEGESAQKPQVHPAVSKEQMKGAPKSFPAGKNLTEHEHANRVNNIVDTYNASSSEQRHMGNVWYRQAHRAAVTVANGEAPGVGNNTPAMKRGVYRKPGVTSEHVERASGAIARLSPSMPAGMDWEHNAQAAHEAGKLTDAQVSKVNRGDQSPKRANSNVALQHAGAHAIVHAHAILHGDTTAEQDLNQKVGKRGATDARKKAGSFHRNIVNPMQSNEVTVDARSAGVAAGHRMGFADVQEHVGKLEGQRYKDYEGAYQDATGIINQHLAQAGKTALQPHQVQATTWVADKQDLDAYLGNRAKGEHLHGGVGGAAKSYKDKPIPFGQRGNAEQ